MLPCSQLALLVASLFAQPAPRMGASAYVLGCARVEFARPALDPFAQGTLGTAPPKWFVAISGNLIKGDFIGPLGEESDDYSAFGFDAGYTNWDNELGISIEAGYLGSTIEVPVNSLGAEDVDTQRFLVGLRLIDRGSSFWLPYLRGGFMWRLDDGDSISDDGSGFYVGGGFDFFLGPKVRLGPQLLYTESESLDTKEWVLGAVLSFGF